jgi:hypothetical protein
VASTYEPIASASVSAVSTTTLSSIPSTYTDLILVAHLSSASDPALYYRVNSDTGNNYSSTRITGNGSAASSGRDSNQTSARFTNVSMESNRGVFILHLMSYANTNVYKTFLSSAAQPGTGVVRVVSLWRSTSAISSITLLPGASNISGDISLYGIKAA